MPHGRWSSCVILCLLGQNATVVGLCEQHTSCQGVFHVTLSPLSSEQMPNSSNITLIRCLGFQHPERQESWEIHLKCAHTFYLFVDRVTAYISNPCVVPVCRLPWSCQYCWSHGALWMVTFKKFVCSVLHDDIVAVKAAESYLCVCVCVCARARHLDTLAFRWLKQVWKLVIESQSFQYLPVVMILPVWFPTDIVTVYFAFSWHSPCGRPLSNGFRSHGVQNLTVTANTFLCIVQVWWVREMSVLFTKWYGCFHS